MSNMKTLTVREVQHGLARVLDEVARGHEIVVTRRGRLVAHIVPATPTKRTGRVRWPDATARMKAIFPDGPPRGPGASELIDEARGERP